MDWKALLADLRAHLPPTGPAGSGGRAQRGSLRWLEREMRRVGGNPASVRNIIYRDVGTAADKAALHALLGELAAEAGRPLPGLDRPAADPAPPELDLLGRSKKRAYRQFLAGVRAGRAPRLIVSGPPGSGKTVLTDQIALALTRAGTPFVRHRLRGEVGPLLNLPRDAGRTYAEQSAAQHAAARALLPGSGVLLVQVGAALSFHGAAPRDTQASRVSAARWAAQALLGALPAGVAALLTVEDPAGLEDVPVEHIRIQPPTAAESRQYLMTRLGVNRAEAERLLAETGRHLDRLTLLVRAHGDDAAEGALHDPDSRMLAEATAALHDLHALIPDRAAPQPPAVPAFPDALLTAALGRLVTSLPAHARALLRPAGPGTWQAGPALTASWPRVGRAPRESALRHVAMADDLPPNLSGARVHALVALHDWSGVLSLLGRHPDLARHLPAVWGAARGQPAGTVRDGLARALAQHFAGRGQYSHPQMRDALFMLMESDSDGVRAWTRVKLAESSLETGNLEAARTQLAHPDVAGLLGDGGDRTRDPWRLSAQAEALLVQAALARWDGHLDEARAAVADPRVRHGGPRALLWRGLIDKDLGDTPGALSALRSVPASSPLLSARARYQEGDLLLRLGWPGPALTALTDALARLEAAGGTAEEQARVTARRATALRRLGRLDEALDSAVRAGALPDPAGDSVLQARLLSERIPILLARQDVAGALLVAARATGLLRHATTRTREASYRERRTRYRAALCLLSRGLGRAYLFPLRGAEADSPDLREARERLTALLTATPLAPDRERLLRLDMLLSLASADPDAGRAARHCEEALGVAASPYELMQVHTARADAHLRAGQAEAALADVHRAHQALRRTVSAAPPAGEAEAPYTEVALDPGLRAQLLTVEARAGLMDPGSRPDALVRWVREQLCDASLQPFRAGVWRDVGEALAARPDAETCLLALHPDAPLDVLTVADAFTTAERLVAGGA